MCKYNNYMLILEYFKKEGDITWVRPEFDEIFGKLYNKNGRSKRLTRTDYFTWDDGVIPFSLSESYSGSYTANVRAFSDLIGLCFTAHDRSVILSALSHYEERTCLRFKERTDETDYLKIYQGAGYVKLGRNNTDKISIINSGGYTSTIRHYEV